MSLKTIKDALPQLISSTPLYSSNVSSSTASRKSKDTIISSFSSAISTANISSAIQRIYTHPLVPTISLFVGTLAIHTLSVKKVNLVSHIYDSVIVHMTEKWYQCVLNQLDENSVILDVGIGTAGALLRCKDIIKAKNLTIIGIDYNQYYITSALQSIEKSDMTKYISVNCINLYDADKLQEVMKHSTKDGKVDVVYFSGSFSLLPDPKGALLMTLPLLRKKSIFSTSSTTSSSGLIYITQTYQKHIFPLLGRIKPLLKYLTTIDFGQLVKVDEISNLLNDEELVSNGIVLKSHDVIEGSLDNYWQAAYLSTLEVGGGSKANVMNGEENVRKKTQKNFWDGLFGF